MAMERLMNQFKEYLKQPIRQPVSKKVFNVDNKEIPLLLDYSGTAPQSWWKHWPCLMWEDGKKIKSGISPIKLSEWARRAKYPDVGSVLDICRDLRYGCDLGTRGEFLSPSS